MVPAAGEVEMTTDLIMLVGTALLSLTLPAIYLVGRMQVPGGMQWALGNRDRNLELAPWAARAIRAHHNLTENLAPFAILVLVAHVTGKANSMTALGATIFFLARIGHAAVYMAGLIGVRTVVFFIGTFGELLILIQLFR
jgi:uncharacterized MAPEG superfamily protein